ncbi:MAG: hypothetical protein KDB23_02490, partial [Planctomycetales bacterium]|nr:hypothetical protein [Planctomycetales bacterium]
MRRTNRFVVFFLAVLVGCSPKSGPIGNSQPGQKNAERFIFLAEGTEPDQITAAGQSVQDIITTTKPGDVVHVLSAPRHHHIATIVVPDAATPNARLRHKALRRPLAELARVFGSQAGHRSSARLQLAVPQIGATVASLRRTDYPCQVILIGTPIFDDPQNPGWKFTDGFVPRDGSLRDARFPFANSVTPFPASTEV